MKRTREPEPSESESTTNMQGIVGLIAESEMADIGECVIRAALDAPTNERLEGLWMLHQTCRFWNKQLPRLLPSTLFKRMDTLFGNVEQAYLSWKVEKTNMVRFPWWKTGLAYSGSAPPAKTQIYRPLFMQWARARYPTPTDAALARRIQQTANDNNRTSWCLRNMFGEDAGEDTFSGLNMAEFDLFPILVRITQISWRCALDAVSMIISYLPHDAIVPLVLFLLASCNLRNQFRDEPCRSDLEMELMDTIVWNRIWGKERDPMKAFFSVLMTTQYLMEI